MILQDCFFGHNNKLGSSHDNKVCVFAYKKCFVFLLLLLSGNVELNPGPVSCTVSKKSSLAPMHSYMPVEDNLNTTDTLDDIVDIFSARGLHIVHLNICSLSLYFDQVKDLFDNGRVGILSFSETRLDDSIKDTEIEIENYTLIRKDRDRNGGGVCVYIRADISFNVRSDMDNKSIEAVWVEINLPKTKPFLVGALYRPPSQSTFYNLLDDVSTDLGSSEAILIGDFNTNIRTKDTSIYKSFLNYCSLHNMVQLIAQYTRVCTVSQTIIDLILTNDLTKISRSGVIQCSLSDHDIIYCTRKLHKSAVNCHNTIRFRSLKNYTCEALNAALEKLDWSKVTNCTSTEEAWACFKSTFLSVVDILAPMKVIRMKVRTQPWMNTDILRAIKERNNKYAKFRKNRNEELFLICKTLRNKVNGMIKSAKKTYFNEKVEENKNKPQKLWKALKELGCSNRLKTKITNLNIKINGSIITEKLNVANCLNGFFTTIATTLVDKLPLHSGRYGEQHIHAFYKNLGAVEDSFKLSSVTAEDVLIKLRALQPTKATGHDGISTRFLRDAADSIAPVVAHISNLSIRQGHVPQDFKLARIVPLHKKGSKLDPRNYRPVSILCSISKVIERLVYEQINTYLLNHKLLFEFQSGFRRSHSTDTCLLYMTDFIRREVDDGKYCGMVMLDLQKAFDTVNHHILLNKLRAIGFDSLSVKWVRSYLEGRKQMVEVNGTLSSPLPVECGVPQGSILGPLLFLIYVNDMKSACNCSLSLFADDAAVIASDRDKSQVERVLSTELSNISLWLSDNKLSLHLGKTESILFGSIYNLNKSPGFTVRVGDNIVTNKEEVTYLGCILDSKLTGEKMALKVISKVNQRTRFLGRISPYANSSALRTLAGALIQCHYDYACTSWFRGISKSLKTKLQTSQNKLVRMLLKLNPRTHLTSAHFRSLGWLRVEERVSQLSLCLVFKILNEAVPNYLVGYLSRVRDARYQGKLI